MLRDHKLLSSLAFRLCLVLCASALLMACSQSKTAAPGVPVVPVLAATVEQKDMPVQVQAIGAVEAYSAVAVKTQITGELTGVYFKEGQDVRKGDLLFTLDKRPFEADLKRQEANLERDTAQAKLAQDLVRVLGEKGRRAVDVARRLAQLDRQPEQPRHAHCRVFPFDDHLPVLHLWVLQRPIERVDRAARDRMLVEQALPLV